MALIQRLTGHEGAAWSMQKRSSRRVASAAVYQASSVTQRLVVNRPIGSPQASIEMPIRCDRASAPLGQGSLALTSTGRMPAGMPGWRTKV